MCHILRPNRIPRHAGLVIALLYCSISSLSANGPIIWSDHLPQIPDEHGFAGAYAGIIGKDDQRSLIFAGGANFPYKNPFDEEKNTRGEQPKAFHSSAYVISIHSDSLAAKGKWQDAEPLPTELAYGASVSLPHDGSTLFIGGNEGSDGASKSASVFRVTLEDGQVHYSRVTSLPVGVTNIAATLVDKTVYVFSGDASQGAVQP